MAAPAPPERVAEAPAADEAAVRPPSVDSRQTFVDAALPN
jgi:hypothetical protein